jgi:hypothetical protein
MNIVINYKNEKININDFMLGRVGSKEYYCIKCDKRVYYVKEHKKTIIDKINNEPKIISIESYFRHDKEGEKETECEYYSDRSTEEKKNEKENRKSEYHNHWQNIFPIEYLEYKIEENNKKHFADIYIYNNNNKEIEINDENNKSLFKNYKPKSLIIEIQYSKISEETLKELLWLQSILKQMKQLFVLEYWQKN